MNNTKFSQTSFGKSSAQMGTFFRHWVIECICVSLLYYIIGEAIYIISRAITSKLYGVYDSSTVDHRVINCFIFIYTGLDYKLPFIKEFIIPYTTSYAFWVVGPFLVYGFMGREKFYQFMLASVAVNLFSLFVFITIPNGIKQDFRPAPSVYLPWENSSNICEQLCYQTFTTDSLDQTFPSGHWCLTLLVMIAFRGSYFKKNVKPSQRFTAWILYAYGIAICLSTLFCKQHYIFDAFVSVALCEFAWWYFAFNKYGRRQSAAVEKWMYIYNCKLGIIKDASIPTVWAGDANKWKSSKFYLIWASWFVVFGGVCAAFALTQWFYTEFLLNLGTFVVWLLIVYLYYIFDPLLKKLILKIKQSRNNEQQY